MIEDLYYTVGGLEVFVVCFCLAVVFALFVLVGKSL